MYTTAYNMLLGLTYRLVARKAGMTLGDFIDQMRGLNDARSLTIRASDDLMGRYDHRAD
jgi:hypothetical protein